MYAARLLPLLLGALALSTPALAQDEEDEPLAYPDDDGYDDDDDAPRKLPRRSTQATPVPREDDDDVENLSGLDDPNTGLAFELVAGAMLLDSSRGRFAETRPGFGVRVTWEYGRLFESERLREALWMDLRWLSAGLSDGTELISSDTRVHYFTLAPAYEFTFGSSQAYGFYAQAGGGFAYQLSSLTVGSAETDVNGLKPVLQYGVGLRGRPRLGQRMSLAFRLELMRFRRGYMDDTFLGGSIGTAF